MKLKRVDWRNFESAMNAVTYQNKNSYMRNDNRGIHQLTKTSSFGFQLKQNPLKVNVTSLDNWLIFQSNTQSNSVKCLWIRFFFLFKFQYPIRSLPSTALCILNTIKRTVNTIHRQGNMHAIRFYIYLIWMACHYTFPRSIPSDTNNAN